MINYLEKRVKYTGNNETKISGRPYLISSSYEINLIADSMERRLGLRYTTLLNTTLRKIIIRKNVTIVTLGYVKGVLPQPKIQQTNNIWNLGYNSNRMYST